MSRPSTEPLLRAGARGKLDSQEDQTCGCRTTDPHGGQKSGKTFSSQPNLTAIPVKGLTLTRGNHHPQVMPWIKKRPRPLESSHSKKPLKECSTPPKAQGLLSGTNTRVPKEEELIVINIDSSEQSRARLRLQPTPGARAPPRLTSGGGLHLARLRGHELRLA